jgi:putative DNA primase/helicase
MKPIDLNDMAAFMEAKAKRDAEAEKRELRRKLDAASASAAAAEAAYIVATEPSPEPSIDQVPAFSDDWIALTFTGRHAHELRYCAAWGKWFIWDGVRWRADETKKIFDLVRKVCRDLAVQCNELNTTKQLTSSKTVAAVKWMAESDRKHATTTEQWDVDPWLLNTPGGTINLRTGGRRPNAQEDYITKVAAVTPEGDCPLWHDFLKEITGGDKDLQDFLQRIFGYALTGVTTEHALFFLYGTGGNGKSVFINTISGILAEYHKPAPIETFTASQSERHPTDLAGLRGARTVTSVETEEGRKWAENKIKALTGGDPISARFMRQDFFEYTPQFKLIIAGNHKPGLRSVDEAIRRRFNLVPFTVTIPPEKRDLDLAEKLKAEWPAILQWGVEGCKQWQKIGLAPPKAVTAATNAYLESEDAVRVWLEECCELRPSAFEPRARLYASWKLWADRTGEEARSAKWLYQRIETLQGVYAYKSDGTRGFRGVHIKQEYA